MLHDVNGSYKTKLEALSIATLMSFVSLAEDHIKTGTALQCIYPNTRFRVNCRRRPSWRRS